jgi:hypothetical protein
MSAPLRQATLSFHSTGRIDAVRLGPKPKAPTTLSSAATAALTYGAARRRKAGGTNETHLIQALERSCAHTAAGEADSNDLEAELDSQSRSKRNAYSREKKLAVVSYLELTDMPNPKAKGDTDAP